MERPERHHLRTEDWDGTKTKREGQKRVFNGSELKKCGVRY